MKQKLYYNYKYDPNQDFFHDSVVLYSWQNMDFAIWSAVGAASQSWSNEQMMV